jgi:hypothetical protein
MGLADAAHLFAHHFQGKVGAQPETVLPAGIGCRKQ